MTASDVMGIVGAVTVTQLLLDLAARRWIFEQEPYRRDLAKFERAKLLRDRIVANQEENKLALANANNKAHQPPKNAEKAREKAAKKMGRAEADVAEAAAEIARRHTQPSFLFSLVFLILYRILSAEYGGRPVAVLPFRPWGVVRRLSAKGLALGFAWDDDDDALVQPDQACSFMFVYLLCTVSIKFFVNKTFGVPPPTGADRGMMNVLDAPKSQSALRSLGVDTDELNEVRKMF